MNKWGVRLIGCLFLIRAISDAYPLIVNNGNAEDLGWRVLFFGANLSGFMPWLVITLLIYIGAQLLRFQPSGRDWALIILWLSTLAWGGILIWVIFLIAKAFFYNETMELSHSSWFGEIRGPIPTILLLAGVFIAYFVLSYYLMRKDVKFLFEKPVAAEESNSIPTGESS